MNEIKIDLQIINSSFKELKEMASRKGIAITIGVLVAITVASFLVWMIPQNYDASFVVSDFESHLDGVKQIHNTINDGIEEEFQNLVNGKITPEEYIKMAETSSSHINSQIIQIVESQATEEWQNSYINYIESLKQSNSYIRETIVVANMIRDGVGGNQIMDKLDTMNQMKSEIKSLIRASDESRP